MENKINIAELLKDCPKGMELDCTLYENVYFNYIEKDDVNYPIRCYYTTKNNEREGISFTSDGRIFQKECCKCAIFPKGKTTWEGFGFVPPYQFKDGDVIYNDNILATAILKENYYGAYSCSYCFLNILGNFKISHTHSGDLSDWRLATEEEKQKLFDAIKENGYKWNEETKTLDKIS